MNYVTVMDIRTINWQETLPIRHKVLWPNKTPDDCIVEGDPQGLHYGIYIDKELACVASLFISEKSVRLRKFATLERFQGKGLGSFMLNHLIGEMKEKANTHFWFDARESALDFYKRFGFTKEGKRFFKSEVPYFKMSKSL